MEGRDVMLLSPEKPTTVTAGDVQLTGETAFARLYQDGTLRLAVIRGQSTAKAGDWTLNCSKRDVDHR
ncbi:MAG: hypothetical protein ACYC7E_04860 [Armatimonadota bacterium]